MSTPIIFDTDIGTNPDDLAALLVLLHHPAAEVKLVVTGNNYPLERAKLAAKVLELAGREDIPVYVGEPTGTIDFHGFQYIHDIADEAVQTRGCIEATRKVVEENEEVVYLAVQGCSNLTAFYKEYPELSRQLKVVHMGLNTTGAEEYIAGGTNIEGDPLGAKCIYEAGLDMKVVGGHSTTKDEHRPNPGTAIYEKLAASDNGAHKLFLDHLEDFKNRRGFYPALHDALAAAVAVGESFVEFEPKKVLFNEAGKYCLSDTGIEVTVSKTEVKSADFMAWCAKWV